ncbi:helix-turn-helix transcriptional regulator [Clostridium estertheticum]|uniref:helix-turn-helix transcriptional regulator n=1 Tax=Clostridium estertheticum TaxID=238834 RepID=UPI001C0D785D|nr:helix-turn-helix domain-containing protein [Clostridium estertheticum]MBU3185529.1 transcriptional regulator [Clostridium estertheticum]
MTRIEFIKKVDEKVKLIRTEKGYTQDKMAEILGISKKTLVQAEKERSSLGWAVAIAVCVIFRDSEILELTFGGDVEDIIHSLSFPNNDKKYIPTLGGRIWWKNIGTKNGFTVQQNMISKYYRILDNNHRRICFSFELEYISKRLKELTD